MRNTQLMSCMDHIEICINDEIKGRRNTMKCLLNAIESGELNLSPNDLCSLHLRGIGVTEMKYTRFEQEESKEDIIATESVEAVPLDEIGGDEDLVHHILESDESVDIDFIESPQWITETAHLVLIVTKICFYALLVICCCQWKPWNHCRRKPKENLIGVAMERESEEEQNQGVSQWSDSSESLN